MNLVISGALLALFWILVVFSAAYFIVSVVVGHRLTSNRKRVRIAKSAIDAGRKLDKTGDLRYCFTLWEWTRLENYESQKRGQDILNTMER